jgi:hypothetical protein
LKPNQVTVTNVMNGQKETKMIPFTHFQSIGFFRMFVAKSFGVLQSEFIMTLGTDSIIDADTFDDKLYHEVQGWQKGVWLHNNPGFDAKAHPKTIISERQEYFDKIFNMLKTSQVSQLQGVYDLFEKLPVNKKLQESFQTL